jgi:multidrug efflux pump subunit AcrB
VEASTIIFRNRHLMFLLAAVILIGGFSALRTLPRLEDPVITQRSLQILTPLPGAGADRVEALVADPIERQLREIPQIKDINKLDQAETEFPPEAGDPIVEDQRGALAFTLLVALSWESGKAESLGVLERYSRELAEELRNLPGTDYVERIGGPREEMIVEADPHELALLGLDFPSFARLLATANARVPSGILRGEESSLRIEVDGEFDSARRLAAVPVRAGGDGTVTRAGDLAEVRKGWRSPPREIAFSGDTRQLFVAARVGDEERVDLWAERAAALVDRFRDRIGGRIDMEIVFDQNFYTSERLGELATNLLLGALVVLIVVFFTMGWRSSWIVASALPLTAGLTLFLLSLTGGKLHQMSIFGMIIALGLLIDNAIVVTDEINRRFRQGASATEAVRGAIRHLFVPLFSSTLTTILAFMPILLLPGNAGDFVSPIASSVILALGSSFFVAMTLVSSFAGLVGGRSRGRKPRWWTDGLFAGKSSAPVVKVLAAGVSRPWASLPGVAALSLTGFALASTLGVQFFPRVDRDIFEVRFWLPGDTSIGETHRTARAIEREIRSLDGVRSVHWTVGASFPSVYYNMMMNKDNSPFYGQGIIYADDSATAKRLVAETQRRLDRKFPGVQALARQFAQGPPAEADIEFRLYGPDFQTLRRLGETVRRELAAHPTVLHTRSTLETGQPRLRLRVDETETEFAGLRLSDIAAQLQASLEGAELGMVLEETQDLPVRVRLPEAQRADLAALRSLPLPTSTGTGGWIPLHTVGDLVLEPEIGAITRRDASRMNAIRGWVRNEALPIDATRAVQDSLEKSGFSMPPGYRFEIGGDSENRSQAVGNLTLYLPVLVMLTLATIVLSFRNVRIAFLLCIVAFLSVGFGLLATWALGFPLSFNTILGSLGLVGLAFNSSIVVLASIRADERARCGGIDALARASGSTLRHLASTTFTTIGSFLPLLLFVGGDFWPPLAIVLVGGVGGSTLLALFFTPAAYRLLRPWEPVLRSRSVPSNPGPQEV